MNADEFLTELRNLIRRGRKNGVDLDDIIESIRDVLDELADEPSGE